MRAPPHPSSRRRCISLIILAAAAVLGSYAAIYSVQLREWRRAVARGRVFEAAIDRRATARSVLWGETTPGDARLDYDAAVAALPDPVPFEIFAAEYRTANMRAKRDQLLRSLEPVLTALRRGTHRADVSRRIDWRAAPPVRLRLDLVHGVADLAALESDRLLEAGQDEAAAQWLLDILQFGRDVTSGPLALDQTIGRMVIDVALERLQHHGLSRFSAAGRAMLERGLARLDENHAIASPLVALLGEAALAIHEAETKSHQQSFVFPRWYLDYAPYDTSVRTELQIGEVALHGPDPDAVSWDGVAGGEPYLCTSLVAHYKRLIATIRMLRMALVFLRGDDVTPLADPSGGTLTFTIEDDTITVGRKRCPRAPGAIPVPLVVRRSPAGKARLS